MPILSVWIDTTCAIMQATDQGKKEIYSKNELKLRGSGILLAHDGLFILVTARHVVEGRRKLAYILNYKNNFGLYFIESVQEELGISWHFHSNREVDIAVTFVKGHADKHFLATSLIIPFKDVKISSNVFILGYPLGIIPDDNFSPLIKKGIISRSVSKNTTFSFSNGDQKVIPAKSFLLDAYIDEGNSGGPIIQEREIWTIIHPDFPTLPKNKEKLIGFARGHFNIGNRNAGLGEVISSDYLLDILNSPAMLIERKKLMNLTGSE